MSEMHDPAQAETGDGQKKEDVELLLNAILEVLEEKPNCSASYVNEFGDFSIVIPLGGDSGALDAFIKKQELFQYLAGIAEHFIEHVRGEGSREVACCFIGFDQQEAPWIAGNNERVYRLKSTLKSLVDSLGIQGACRYLVEEPFGSDSVLAEVIRGSNAYLEASKEWEGVPADWKPVEIEEIPSSPEGGSFPIDCADIVIALVNGDGDFAEERCESRTLKALCSSELQEKPTIVFWTSWFETDWPVIDKIGTQLPEDLMLQLADECGE